jgi:hypothetical protein
MERDRGFVVVLVVVVVVVVDVVVVVVVVVVAIELLLCFCLSLCIYLHLTLCMGLVDLTAPSALFLLWEAHALMLVCFTVALLWLLVLLPWQSITVGAPLVFGV